MPKTRRGLWVSESIAERLCSAQYGELPDFQPPRDLTKLPRPVTTCAKWHTPPVRGSNADVSSKQASARFLFSPLREMANVARSTFEDDAPPGITYTSSGMHPLRNGAETGIVAG